MEERSSPGETNDLSFRDALRNKGSREEPKGIRYWLSRVKARLGVVNSLLQEKNSEDNPSKK